MIEKRLREDEEISSQMDREVHASVLASVRAADLPALLQPVDIEMREDEMSEYENKQGVLREDLEYSNSAPDPAESFVGK